MKMHVLPLNIVLIKKKSATMHLTLDYMVHMLVNMYIKFEGLLNNNYSILSKRAFNPNLNI